jgi:predicted nucleic acid-binding protein
VTIISNTTVLSNFARIGEIQQAQAEGYAFFDGIEAQIAPFVPDGWLELVTMGEEELRQFASMTSGLHGGERACLAIAGKRAWLLLTDDRAARTEAQRRNIACSGSIGCLVRCVERKHLALDQANRLLATMIAQGYHAPLTDLAALVQPDP